ncbi:MAG: Rab family GTPase [Candidatus Atabeyarchaeum deiterrae]
MSDMLMLGRITELLGNRHTMKVCVVGSDAVGKRSLIFPVATSKFSDSYFSSIGTDFGVKVIKWGNTDIRLQFWILRPGNQFERVRRFYFENSKSVIFCFDLSRPQSLMDLSDGIIEETLTPIADARLSVLLVGCKADLASENAYLTKPIEDAISLIRRIKGGLEEVPFISTSALTGMNVHKVFYKSAELYLRFGAKKISEISAGQKEMLKEPEEKSRERTQLLMRLFGPEELFRIGKSLNLDYFKGFSSQLNMKQHQAALEIAWNIDDSDLIRLTGGLAPERKLTFGGFYGKYYSVSEIGRLTHGGSWNIVRENCQTALGNWGDGAYGVLRAFVNRNGVATYLDLVGETESILGYEIAPSGMLKNLESLRLVFETGSSNYPNWQMPPEIITLIREELDEFKRPLKPHVTLTPGDKMLSLEKRVDNTVRSIVEARRNLNLIFKSRFGTGLFIHDEIAISYIREPCSSEEEFNSRILSLATLIDGIETKPIKALIKSSTPDRGSVNIIDVLLREVSPDFDEDIIKTLRNIITLRSKKYPVHRDEPEFLKALRYFGFETFPPDWQALWEKVLQKYLNSLERLVSEFGSIE